MNTLRRFGLGLAVFVFSSSLSLVALVAGWYAVFETPLLLKQALRASDIYSVSLLTPSSIESDTPLATSDPGIQQAFASALTPTFVQNTSEQAIDNLYDWVHGITATLDFSVPIEPVKAAFANNVAAYVQQKFDALPVCTQAVAQPLNASEALELSCRPPGVSGSSLAESARQQVLESSFLSEGNTIDGATLKDTEGRPLSETLAFIPTLYRYYLISLYVLPILLLLCAVAIVYWSATKRMGVKRIAWVLVGIGSMVVILSLAGVWLLQMGATLFGAAAESSAIQSKVFKVLEILASDLRNWWLGFGLGYVVTGILLLVVLRLRRPKVLALPHANNVPQDAATSDKNQEVEPL